MPRAKKPAADAAGEPKPRRTRRKKIAPASTGLAPAEVVGERASASPSLAALAAAIEADGGAVAAAYREPLCGRDMLFAALPVDKVEPTPYQRDISPAHVKRLAEVISRSGRFLDPLIVVREADGRYHTPNGHHRLAAMRELGAKTVMALVADDPRVAFQILALNVEKAHNLREKALEVVRMARALALDSDRNESDFALEFEEPALVTLGIAYERRPRFSGGPYHPVLRRVDAFLEMRLAQALAERERRAGRLLELDDLVAGHVAALKERGHQSPYLKAFLVARFNPLRFRRGATLGHDECIEKMTEAARKFDPGKVRSEDLARAAGPPEAADG